MILRRVEHPHVMLAGNYAGGLAIIGMFLLSLICFASPPLAWLRRRWAGSPGGRHLRGHSLGEQANLRREPAQGDEGERHDGAQLPG
jgi:hypothetical protein